MDLSKNWLLLLGGKRYECPIKKDIAQGGGEQLMIEPFPGSEPKLNLEDCAYELIASYSESRGIPGFEKGDVPNCLA